MRARFVSSLRSSLNDRDQGPKRAGRLIDMFRDVCTPDIGVAHVGREKRGAHWMGSGVRSASVEGSH
jgi:hypothetical protein